MLKITITETATELKWTLQGRLVALWAGELRKSWNAAKQARDGRSCVVDLNDVTLMDEGGEKLLRTMAKEGAQLTGNGVFIKHFLEELKSGKKRGPAVGHRLLILLLFAAFAFLTVALAGCKQKTVQLPPTDVLVGAPVQQDVAVYSEWVATLDGYTNAEIRPQVSGYLIRQNYTEGSVVRKDQVLFEIDPRPFQATLAHAKGQLAQAEAKVALGNIDVERDTPLVAQKAVAKEKLDNEIQAKRAAEAEVLADKAAVERAELELGWTKVTSLVDGVAGICQVQMGNLVGPPSHLTSVSQVDPIKVYFPISEQEYLRAKHVSTTGQPMDLYDSAPELILADGTVYPHKGKILLTDRQVDVSTGTIRLVAAFPNPGNILRPGQYGRVRIQTSTKKNALLVPQGAVKELQGGYQLALVGADKKAIIRPVKAGQKVGTLWVIDEGLKADDQVIVEGVDKVKDGTPVVPKPARVLAEGR